MSEYRRQVASAVVDSILGTKADGLHEVVLRAVQFAEERVLDAEREVDEGYYCAHEGKAHCPPVYVSCDNCFTVPL